ANKNNFDKAKYYYEKAIALGDVYPQPHHNLGNMYINLGSYDKAEKEYLRAIEIDKTFSFSYNSLYNLYIFQKETKKAEEIKKKFEGLFLKS
ncbi:MAG: tetratricopeptide repeat protein, partial [bacterium]|nr:tetratricopeptide repeat protein [bacterium]